MSFSSILWLGERSREPEVVERVLQTNGRIALSPRSPPPPPPRRRSSLPRFPDSRSPLSLSPLSRNHHFHSQVRFTMAALPEIKLFGKWSYEDVEVRIDATRSTSRSTSIDFSLSLSSIKATPAFSSLRRGLCSWLASLPSPDDLIMSARVILEQEKMRNRAGSGRDGRRKM